MIISSLLAIRKERVLFCAMLILCVCHAEAQQVLHANSNAAANDGRESVIYATPDIHFSPHVAQVPGYGLRSLAARDTSQRMNYRMSLFTGFYYGWGQAHGYAGVAPSFSYRLDDKWTLKANFAVTTDMAGHPYAIREGDGRSWAPRRRSTTTGAAGMDVAAEYRPNDRTMIAAHLYYLGGNYTPVWSMSNRMEDLSVWGGSMEFHYRTRNDNTLSLYLNVMNDETGALYPWLYYPGAGRGTGLLQYDAPWLIY